ncbi:hypothetical protein RFI_22506 [Reticulomyxa filosa]|uniref:Centrosomal protein POC5 n=1 Tax=Reticulomyxa filosa TaxID=46433 RepID=X6MML5_RETFI|nr:hypothetical protein RFI_22506 [Reticulomyxa filosa]|eukprot:ETO14861.1 hypothetical protein RFI_22506 [Reticulomyxa filosa]
MCDTQQNDMNCNNEKKHPIQQEENRKISCEFPVTNHFVKISDVDMELLNTTLQSFTKSIKDHFMSSRERLLHETDNAIHTQAQQFQQTLEHNNYTICLLATKRNKELAIHEKENAEKNVVFNELTIKYHKVTTNYVQSNAKLKSVKCLTRSFMLWKINSQKKNFMKKVRYVIVPNQQKNKLHRLFFHWKKVYFQRYKAHNDQLWNQRLETLSSKIIGEYENCLKQMREELRCAQHKVYQMETQQKLVEENMKKAFMRGVSALNLEAMALSSRHIFFPQNEIKKQTSNINEPNYPIQTHPNTT